MPHLGNQSLLRIFAKHEPYTDGHLQKVLYEMKSLGPPTIKVIEWNNHYYALEGSHRLAAAFILELIPNIVIVQQDSFDPSTESFWERISLPHYTWLTECPSN